jgi:NTP pyrophosphatase (non-canonical NTP hydrolase)
MEQFNELTPAEMEALVIVAEECAEVIQAIAKIQRHGLRSYHPVSMEKNITSLAKELGDLSAAFLVLRENVKSPFLSDTEIARHVTGKIKRLRNYVHHVEIPK